MAVFTIRETGRAGGYVTHDVFKDEEMIAPGVTFLTATTMVQDLIRPGDTYREEYLGGGTCAMDYTALCASWARMAAFDRGDYHTPRERGEGE